MESLARLGSVLAALAAIWAAIVWAVRFLDRQKKQDNELSAIRRENKFIFQGVLACLKGLKEQGCDGAVTTTLNTLENYLNDQAHKVDEGPKNENQ
jgi:Na+/H+ antiporter NhaD/arsenite permease-like protein